MAKQELVHDAACRAIPVAWFLPNRPKRCILMNEPKCQAPIHVFHHLARVKFRVHIQHRQLVERIYPYSLIWSKSYLEQTFSTNKLLVELQYMIFITWSESCFQVFLEAIISTDRTHVDLKWTKYLICHEWSFEPIFSTDMYFWHQYTNFLVGAFDVMIQYRKPASRRQYTNFLSSRMSCIEAKISTDRLYI